MWDELESQAKSYIDQAIREYNPADIFVGLSGGGDSMLAAHVVKKFYPDAKMFHANTGIGIKKTRQFVRDYCKKKEWELVEIRAKEDCNQDYEQLVLDHGFPGPSMHGKMYQRLKERAVRELHRRYKKKRGGKIILATGIRYDESVVRAGYKDRIIDTVDGVVWVNPVYWFTSQQKYDYLKQHNIPTNPVSDILGMSGECLCGAFAHTGELELIRLVEPETAQYIEELQERVWAAGHFWKWEERPSNYTVLEKRGQGNLFRPMCIGCGKREEDFNPNQTN